MNVEYKNEPAFINRQEEMAYLKSWMAERPKQILFFYGPKSSGKTTLIYKYVERHLADEQKFSVKLFNLRKVLIVNYEDFLQRFFQLEEPVSKDTRMMREYSVKVFKLTMETQKKIRARELDPFDVMEAELKALNARGIKPVLIVDELQALDFIYFNGQRELIKELLNFFVAMTKESHLCHILLSSSDGYFIEKLYNDSKLRKTAKLFEVDYLPKEDIVYWLTHLEKESCIRDYVLSTSQIEMIWEHLGGSIWEISALLGDFLRVCRNGVVDDADMADLLERYLRQAQSYFTEYASLDPPRTELLREINRHVQTSGSFQEPALGRLLTEGFYSDKKGVQDEMDHLVRQNFLYYNPTRAEYKLQGRSMEIGLERYVRDVQMD